MESPDFANDIVAPFKVPDYVPEAQVLLPASKPSVNLDVLGQSVNPAQPDFGKQLKSAIENVGAYGTNPYKRGKVYAFDASDAERYYSVPSLYKKLGYSPWIDNETRYNKEITWFQDWKRSAKQAAAMIPVAFKSMAPWNVWSSDPLDRESAEAMERANMIGRSSKTGIGGFFNNLTMNAGYTLGMGAEFVVEELDRKSTRLNSSHVSESRMPSSA